mgnify:CR=1 FL=1
MFLMQKTVFVFQAEDGIRDLVRSRGLGDVYKRQTHGSAIRQPISSMPGVFQLSIDQLPAEAAEIVKPVSYTHLTLPTSDLV